MRRLAFLFAFLAVTGCTAHHAANQTNRQAEAYVKLVLALGEHDADWVDAYYGPASWRQEAKTQHKGIAQIRADAVVLRAAIIATPEPAEQMERLRRHYQLAQLDALITRAEMLEGRKLPFEEEARRLYGITPPRHDDAFFAVARRDLERELPGEGPLGERIDAYRRKFEVPRDRVGAVMQAALKECRARTLAHIALPPGESFDLEYVHGQPWAAYNWYKGGYHSLIQVNTDLPLRIDRALDLACHEGYPGHHTYNALLEKNLVRDRGWVEFSVYPLNSPQSLIAEGSGNYGLTMAFPGNERMEFDRDVLFPIAGLDRSEAARYYRVLDLTGALGYATNEAARRLLDGELTREEAKRWLVTNALAAPEQAEKSVSFIERYRSYVINYNVGRDLVRDWVERAGSREERWSRFIELLSTPMLPSNLVGH
jgi:hypothetical protein